ncbi:MAG: DUF1460 domain-containing protein [Fermentimonas sp.]|nr:DUF1460 domain-containing protein [Fermentimonas sp.]MDD4008594.1 DUF1460 domain-containing protein [Fermentimonas sp.]MDD4697248.1 DUF1460 domain-containing protein [Fermentimonas sp.]
MKKTVGIEGITFILTLTLIFVSVNLAAQPRALYMPEDIQVFNDYIDYIESWSSDSKEQILEKTAAFFIGRPYVAHTLDSSDVEVLTVNLREFDCFTFVETVIALTLTVMTDDPDFNTFTDKLQSIRYRSNEISGYQSRLHYTTDWIFENNKNGILKNISGEIGGVKDDKVINFMSEHRTSYSQLKSDDNVFNEIIKVENHINNRDGFYYLPKDKIAINESLIPHMSVVGFTTSLEGLDVTHVGFAFRNDGELKFIHASSVINEVIIDELTLSDYCISRNSCTGIIIAKVL